MRNSSSLYLNLNLIFLKINSKIIFEDFNLKRFRLRVFMLKIERIKDLKFA